MDYKLVLLTEEDPFFLSKEMVMEKLKKNTPFI